MSDGIYYNQEVTADTLNGIAIDLGATSFNGFGTEKFGANELNEITKALVGKGVLLSGDMCRPVISEGLLYISTGTIVFSNGAKKVITEPVNVPLTANTCIYAYNNITAGTCSIVSAEAFPEDDNYIKLATINASGNVTDERELSTSKVLLNAGNNEITTIDEAEIYSYRIIASYSNQEWDSHKYMIISPNNISGVSPSIYYRYDTILQLKYITFGNHTDLWEDYLLVYNNCVRFVFEKKNNGIDIYAGKNIEHSVNAGLTITLV